MATEAFSKRPRALRDRHPELYTELERFFCQDRRAISPALMSLHPYAGAISFNQSRAGKPLQGGNDRMTTTATAKHPATLPWRNIQRTLRPSRRKCGSASALLDAGDVYAYLRDTTGQGFAWSWTVQRRCMPLPDVRLCQPADWRLARGQEAWYRKSRNGRRPFFLAGHLLLSFAPSRSYM